MAIDFNKPSGGRSGGSDPFDEAPVGGGRKNGGFSFGGGGARKDTSGSSGDDFDEWDDAPAKSRSNGFSGLPEVRGNKQVARRDRSTPRRRSGVFDGFSSDTIPWRAIIYVLLAVAVVALVIIFWDVITYVFTQLIVLLIIVLILLLLIRSLLRPRR